MKITDQEIKLVVEIVRNAIRITEWFKKKGFQSYIKQDQSPVTLADFASQIYIISKLKEIFPEDSIIAEENFSTEVNLASKKLIYSCYNELDLDIKYHFKDILNYRGKLSETRWSIDPIDGTKGYQEGLSYAIGIGLIDNLKMVFSVIGVPNYINNQIAIFYANKGRGANASYGDRGFKSISVNDKKNVKDYLLCYSLHYDEPWVMKLAKIIGINKYIQIDSMAKFCMIADGSADLYLKPMNKDRSFIWDFLPGHLLVTEAGGIVTDLMGQIPQYVDDKCIISGPGLVVSNGKSHEEIIETIRNNPTLFN